VVAVVLLLHPIHLVVVAVVLVDFLLQLDILLLLDQVLL
jgi:hypothetical protein